MKNKNCLVIVPIFNEKENIRKVLEDLQNYFENIIVINDGSDDSSYEHIKSQDIYYLKHIINLGQGASIDSGLRYFLSNKKFDYAITFDGDGQNQAIDADRMIKYAKQMNLSAVLGTRFKQKYNTKTIPFIKRCTLYLAVLYERLIFNIKLTDAHNGLRVLKKDLVKNVILPLKNFDMSHATEISYKICKSEFKYGEYPVNVEYKNKRSQSPINAINIAIKNMFKPL